MGGRVSTEIANRVLFRGVRAPWWVTCLSHRRGALASLFGYIHQSWLGISAAETRLSKSSRRRSVSRTGCCLETIIPACDLPSARYFLWRAM
jgi:hypothetical protein